MLRAISISSTLGFWLAMLGVLGIVLSPIGYRLGWWDFPFALRKLLAFATIVCMAGFVLCLLSWLTSKFAKIQPPGGGLVFALILSGALTAYVLVHLQKVRSLPMIHDITTDTVNPPSFVALADARKAAPNGASYKGAELAAQQRAAYPGVMPLKSPLAPAALFAKAEAAARAAGWAIVAAEPGEGRIEATATTLLYGFKDDMVIRIRPDGAGSVLDMRSMSRVGISDVGLNAKRILAFTAQLRQ